MGEVKSYGQIFDCPGVVTLNPCVVQGQTMYLHHLALLIQKKKEGYESDLKLDFYINAIDWNDSIWIVTW